jgi:signal transduction histidine kinase
MQPPDPVQVGGYDITRFSLADMTRCGVDLRRMGAGASSMEGVAADTVRYLHARLKDPSLAAPACALVRTFVTLPFSALQPDQYPDRFQQILLNLLSNAIKFTPPGGQIAIACDSVGDRLHIKVRDTGVGIPADKLDQVFEPFVQLDRGQTPNNAGTGLGLAISRDLAQSMGGDLKAESAIDSGSTFTLIIPRSPAQSS